MDDYRVNPRSAKDIEAATLAWREALGVCHDWAPDVVRLLEKDVPKLVRQFALIIRPDAEMTANVLCLVIGVLVVAVVVLGQQPYEAKKEPKGAQLSIGERGISIETK